MARSMLDSLLDSLVLDADGAKIGKVKQIYLDNDSGSPTWVAVSTGLFSSDSLVPLMGARRQGDNDALRVQVSKDRVKSAPHLVSDGRISRDAETELFSHYGIDPRQSAWDHGAQQIRPGSVDPMPRGRADAAPREAGMVRSQDQLAFGAERELGKHQRPREELRDRW
ncbi:PRC-barrel domain-containing protein [Nocardia shimofusensis]|uniref:PRC-barrel domain-containing protein n=1 Tax=Nocardia shimofusensis TaxID=228596 RepID=UPI000A012857|nr:PRC-barrel domain-containing protein [Nocardia shimofusensis]